MIVYYILIEVKTIHCYFQDLEVILTATDTFSVDEKWFTFIESLSFFYQLMIIYMI